MSICSRPLFVRCQLRQLCCLLWSRTREPVSWLPSLLTSVYSSEVTVVVQFFHQTSQNQRSCLDLSFMCLDALCRCHVLSLGLGRVNLLPAPCEWLLVSAAPASSYIFCVFLFSLRAWTYCFFRALVCVFVIFWVIHVASGDPFIQGSIVYSHEQLITLCLRRRRWGMQSRSEALGEEKTVQNLHTCICTLFFIRWKNWQRGTTGRATWCSQKHGWTNSHQTRSLLCSFHFILSYLVQGSFSGSVLAGATGRGGQKNQPWHFRSRPARFTVGWHHPRLHRSYGSLNHAHFKGASYSISRSQLMNQAWNCEH